MYVHASCKTDGMEIKQFAWETLVKTSTAVAVALIVVCTKRSLDFLPEALFP